MAQKGREGPRTYYSALCPDVVLPNRAPLWVKIKGFMLWPGDPGPTEFESDEWAEAFVSIATGGVSWTGSFSSHSQTVDYTLFHQVSLTEAGIDWFLLTSTAGGGFSLDHLKLVSHDHSSIDDVLMTGWDNQGTSDPLGPVGALAVNMRHWSQM